MRNYALSHLSDVVLLRDLASLLAGGCDTTAAVLAHLAEVDARKLYVPAGYSSMFVYCVDQLHLSEDAASKRIQAARAARRFPALFEAVAEGRLHLSAVCLLTPHLTAENAAELIAAATHRRKSEVEELVVRRFPQASARVSPVATIRPIVPHAPGHVGPSVSSSGMFDQALGAYEQAGGGRVFDEHAPGHVAGEVTESIRPPAEHSSGAEAPVAVPVTDEHAPGHVEDPRTEAPPHSTERFLVKVTIDKATHDKLRRVQVLLSHTVSAGDVAQVLDRALDSLLKQLEKRKLGAASGRPPQPQPVTAPNRSRPRYVPPHVRRAVWERDAGRCTFVSASGHRCTERRFLEFDHIEPVARGGKATVLGMRLRCRAHNQFEAERVLGVDFMEGKRVAARRASAARASSATPGGSTGEAHPRPAWGRAQSRSAFHEAPLRRTESTGRSPRQR